MQKQNVILQTNGKVQPENVTHIKETDRQTDRQTDRHIEVYTDRQTKKGGNKENFQSSVLWSERMGQFWFVGFCSKKFLSLLC